MTCADYRKQLKEYSTGKIKDEIFLKEIEEHIQGCAVCKKELLMWQVLNDRKQELAEMQKNLGSDSLARIKYRMESVDREPDYPPAVRKLRKANSMLAVITGRMTGTVIMLLGLVFIYKAVAEGYKPLSIGLILFGFIIFTGLFFRARMAERKKKDRD